MSKNGTDFYMVDDAPDSIKAALDKGYKPYVDVTKNGKDIFTIEGTEDSIFAAVGKGYKQIDEHSRQKAEEDAPSTLESYGRGLAQGATLNFSDEIIGGVEGAFDSLTSDKSFGDAYREHRDESREANAEAEARNPKSYFIGELAGGMALPIGVGSKAKTLLTAAGTGAGVGAVTGAVAGAGKNKNSDNMVGDVGRGALAGAFTGAIGGGIGHLSKGITKAGRGELKAEWDAFKTGAKNAEPSDIPVYNQAKKFLAGAKETLDSAGATQEFKNMIAKSKASYVSQMAENGMPQNELKSLMNFMDKMSNEEYITSRLLEGDTEITDWLAKQAGAGNFRKEYTDFLRMSPEERLKLRDMDIKSEAKELVPVADNAQKAVWQRSTDEMGKLTEQARNSFDNDITSSDLNSYFKKHNELANDLESMKSLVGRGSLSRVDTASNLITTGTGGRKGWNLDEEVWLRDVTPEVKFNRFQKAREIIDGGIDWEKINNGVRKPTEAEKILMDYRSEIDGLLKKVSGKTEADAVYKTTQELDDLLFNKTEFKGGVDPYKIKRLLGDSPEASRFRDGLTKLEDWAKNNEDPAAKAAAQEFLDKFKALFNKKTKSDALWGLQREGGPTALQVQRLQRQVGGDKGVISHAIKQPADFLKDNEAVTSMLQETIGKRFSDMTDAEKSAFVKVYLQYKSEGGVAVPEAIKNNFNVFLKRANK
jgi:hypothetical protein